VIAGTVVLIGAVSATTGLQTASFSTAVSGPRSYECDGTVYEYTTAGTLVTSWSDGENPTGVVAGGGGFIYTVNGTAIRVWTPTGTLSRTITLAGSPGNWGISAGEAGVFISAGGKTYEYSPTTGIRLQPVRCSRRFQPERRSATSNLSAVCLSFAGAVPHSPFTVMPRDWKQERSRRPSLP
jgi:hypothetical protein